MNKNEYGGYLPLELKNGNHYYCYSSDEMQKYNSGLTAIYAAIKNINPNTIYLPFFICASVTDMIEKMGIKVYNYHIDERFNPVFKHERDKKSCLLIVNYFGVCTNVIKKYVNDFESVIIDNTQAFFSHPIFQNGVYNVYSCRKFLGTSDGGYLIGKSLKHIDLQKDYSTDRSLFLLRQYEEGINAGYKEFLDDYNIIKGQRRLMSDLTDRILSSIDYTTIKTLRRRNYDFLHKQLGKYNLLQIETEAGDIPYNYPLLLPFDAREDMINKRIYVSTSWKELIKDNLIGTKEYEYSKYILHLPMDQRYDENDMNYISHVVFSIIERKQYEETYQFCNTML